jgi:hypothetical protein
VTALPGDSARTWIWPWRPSRRIREAAWTAATAIEPFVRGPRWVAAAFAVGAIPALVGVVLGSWLHQPFTGLALAALVLACVPSDRFARAAGIVALAVTAHSVVAITATVRDPDATAPALRGSKAYWQTTWNWVRTGDDNEYRTSIWLPRQLALVGVGTAFGYTSLGTVPFVRGIEEIDLMNHYVGRLIRASQRPEIALLCGWHPWSFLRGLAYLCLVFEVVSLSLARLTGRTFSTRRRRIARWTAGMAFVVLDGTVKLLFAPAIRDVLFTNLKPEILSDY